MRALWISFALLVCGSVASAQGTIQARDPRRPPPLERSERCEVWEGTIAGNDRSAQASMRVCAEEGPRVSGTFLWSSLVSGWDRRAFVGEWSADASTLTLRDTHMIESHPMNGWMLCTADHYVLRRATPTRLDGSYVSEGCNDRGTMSLLLRGDGDMRAAPPTDRAARPPPRARGSRGCGCASTRSASAGGAMLTLLAALSMALGVRSAGRRR